MNSNERPLVIYHGNCADGFSAAWCFWRKYGDGADYYAGVYSKPPPDVTGRHVYMVDFSYEHAVLMEMAVQAKSIAILDHHKTAVLDLAGLPQFSVGWQVDGMRSLRSAFKACFADNKPLVAACFDMERSGATLAWDFLFHLEQRPLLLGHVEDRDLWRFKLPNTREIQANVVSFEYTFANWDKLMSAGPVELMQMTVAGAAIERKHHKDIAELVKVCKRRMTIGGHPVLVASLPYTMASDAAHLMAEDEPFAACYIDTATGRTFSLRSRDDRIDVSLVAEQYGGGGHASASGFTVPRDHPLAKA